MKLTKEQSDPNLKFKQEEEKLVSQDMNRILDLTIFEQMSEIKVPNSKTSKLVEAKGTGTFDSVKKKEKWKVLINFTIWQLNGRKISQTNFENCFSNRFW